MEVQNKKTVVHDLLENGKAKGSLSTKEISDAFGDMDIEPDDIEASDTVTVIWELA